MAKKKYLAVDERTSRIVLLSDTDANQQGMRPPTPTELMLHEMKKDVSTIKGVANVIGILIVIGVGLSILGSCGALMGI